MAKSVHRIALSSVCNAKPLHTPQRDKLEFGGQCPLTIRYEIRRSFHILWAPRPVLPQKIVSAVLRRDAGDAAEGAPLRGLKRMLRFKLQFVFPLFLRSNH